MTEIWKNYKAYSSSGKGNHNVCISDIDISNEGNVRGRIWNRHTFNDDMIVIKYGRKHIVGTPIFRLVWQVFCGTPPKGYVIHHIDHNKLNDNLANLTLMSVQEHAAHHSTGRHKMLTEETKRKISEAKKGKPGSNKGKPMSDEQKLKISMSHKGLKMSEEAKQKMSNSKRGHITSEETKQKLSKSLKNRKFSEETRRKMSEAAKNRRKNK